MTFIHDDVTNYQSDPNFSKIPFMPQRCYKLNNYVIIHLISQKFYNSKNDVISPISLQNYKNALSSKITKLPFLAKLRKRP